MEGMLILQVSSQIILTSFIICFPTHTVLVSEVSGERHARGNHECASLTLEND